MQRAPERREIQRDVGRPAGPLLGGTRLDDRHGRFGRDARGIAEPVLVQHRVAGNEHAQPGKIWDCESHR